MRYSTLPVSSRPISDADMWLHIDLHRSVVASLQHECPRPEKYNIQAIHATTDVTTQLHVYPPCGTGCWSVVDGDVAVGAESKQLDVVE